MTWYYSLNGQQLGPVADEEFARLVAAGTITATTLVWKPGLPQWQTYAALRGVAGTPGVDPDSAVCAVSGKVRPKREMIQYEGQWVSAEHRDEFFQRLREGAAPSALATAGTPGPYGYGGFWIRFLARIIDGLILGAVFVPLMIGLVFLFVVPFTAASKGGGEPPIFLILLLYPVMFALIIGIGLSYDLYFIRKQDATPGKKALGLKLVRSSGASLTTGRIVGRHFAYILNGFVPFNIGFIIAGFDDQKRALHDHLADTRVVKTRY